MKVSRLGELVSAFLWMELDFISPEDNVCPVVNFEVSMGLVFRESSLR